MVAFEVPNLSRLRLVVRLLHSVEGVSNVRARSLLKGPMDVHVEFSYQDQEFIVWELYEDNSRYWIGPKSGERNEVDLREVEKAFRNHQSSLFKFLTKLKQFIRN
jgi:hypothetical protein